MADRLSTVELDALEALYARQPRDEYLPAFVAKRNRQIRRLIDEVKMRRASAGADGEATIA